MSADSEPAYFSRQSMQAVPWILASKVLLFFAYFGISVLIVRGLGKEEYGIFSILKAIADILVIVCGVGMNAAILRFVPELAVHSNRAGLFRLLWKTAALQLGLSLLVTVLLIPLTPVFSAWFRIDFGLLLVVTGISVTFVLAKSWYNDVLTSLFLGRWVALISLVQGVSWAVLLGWLVSRHGATVMTVLWVEVISIALSSAVAGVILWRALRGLNWRSPVEGIGRKRVLSMGLATWGGSIGRAFMMRYTETFFLGIYFGPATVAIYNLGFSSTMLVITFIPMALQTLFSSGLAEAYVKNPECLPRLVSSLYKVLILLSVPVAAFGVFFAPAAVTLFYGDEMAGAGWIASAFCGIHLLPLIAIPLSLAVGAREKVKEFLPLLYFRVGVNVLLDWLLIPPFGIGGALAALLLTFVLTFPLRLRLVRSILGGFHFPVWFLVRFVVVCPVVAGVLWWLIPAEHFLTLFLVAGIYFVIFFLLLRFARLLQHGDVAELRALEFGKLNRLLDLLIGPRA